MVWLKVVGLKVNMISTLSPNLIVIEGWWNRNHKKWLMMAVIWLLIEGDHLKTLVPLLTLQGSICFHTLRFELSSSSCIPSTSSLPLTESLSERPKMTRLLCWSLGKFLSWTVNMMIAVMMRKTRTKEQENESVPRVVLNSLWSWWWLWWGFIVSRNNDSHHLPDTDPLHHDDVMGLLLL